MLLTLAQHADLNGGVSAFCIIFSSCVGWVAAPRGRRACCEAPRGGGRRAGGSLFTAALKSFVTISTRTQRLGGRQVTHKCSRRAARSLLGAGPRCVPGCVWPAGRRQARPGDGRLGERGGGRGGVRPAGVMCCSVLRNS